MIQGRDAIGYRRRAGRQAGGTATTVLLACLFSLRSAVGVAGDRVEYNRDIRPILSENCFPCHGPDKSYRKADLRLDLRDAAVDQGAIVPGNPDESELVVRIDHDDPEGLMPPPKSNKTLSAADKERLRRWVAEGAEYQPHWAYVPPRRPEVPETRRRDRVRNPIDAFILGAIEAKGAGPSPEADRRTLLRRLSLDLTGLPPTPEEVRAFLDDPAPDAYERQVDRLLASPHYGERMAAPWLDLVRFADTVGYHGDQNQHVFPYRDYVIDSFNNNTPFDRFTREQLAGDLLPDATTEQRVATGFNRLNMVTREGGAQPKEYLAKYAADRVRTVATTWLGSTMGCCECHDHKFDPFSAKDFYSLSAFFADVKQWGVYQDYAYTPNPDLRGWSNDHPFPPEIEVESPYLKRRMERITREIGKLFDASADKISAAPERRAAFAEWAESGRAFLRRNPSGWSAVSAEVEIPEGAEAKADKKAGKKPKDPPTAIVREDGSVLVQGPAQAGGLIRFRIRAEASWLAAIRLEVLPDPRNGGQVTRNGGGSTLVGLTAALKPAGSEQERQLSFWHADADAKEERYANGSTLLGVADGWKTSLRHKTRNQTSVWRLDRPVSLDEGDRLTVTVASDHVGRVRLSLSPFVAEDPRQVELEEADLEAIRCDSGSRTPETTRRLRRQFLLATDGYAEALARYQGLRRQLLECRDGKSWTLVTEAAAPPTTRVLRRGNFLDEGGEVVSPGVPGFLAQPANSEGRLLSRLDLAGWLTAPENPLTARVFVNRLWKQHFGQAISSVVDDLGAQGEWPSHPELLDWLAVEFRESGWDVKHMVKLMVTSATYRQDSRPNPGLREADPNNRLFGSQNPRRLEAEFVRDNALAVAGLLNRDLGGPSAFPFQPGGYYANLQFPNRDYEPDADERQHRRGVYMHWQRTFLHPMLANFDAPSREECTASRSAANTPQQALNLLNDPTFLEAARALAHTALSGPARSDPERLDALFETVLARPMKDRERPSLVAFLEGQRADYRGRTDDARKLAMTGSNPAPSGLDDAEVAAWINVCRVVLNLHETITRF